MRALFIAVIGIVALSFMAPAVMAESAADKFSAYDKNEDASISRHEWFEFMNAEGDKEMKKRMKGSEEVDWSKGMTEREYYDALFWEYDRDESRSLSHKEWTSFLKGKKGDFYEADVDRDKRLSREEFAADRFTAYDKNEDASISREEWFEMISPKAN